MTMYVDPAQIVFGAFDALEPSRAEWAEQFDYWRDYVEKFFRSNGLPFTPADSNVEQWLMAPDRAPFSEMVRQLLPRLAAQADLSGTEAILFAHWLPDLHMGTSVTNFAMHELGLKNCFGFAISDRGLSAPFFAFDTLHKYLAAKGCSGLLLVADQKHLLYKSKLVDDLAPRNAATAIRLDPANREGFSYRGYRRAPFVAGASVDGLLDQFIDDLDLDRGAVTVIGPASLVQGHATDGIQLVFTDERLVCSAPFAALADAPDLARDHLLLCQDGRHVTALGFGALRT
jgi:hypothetical protein